MKKIVGIIVVIAVLIGGFYYFSQSAQAPAVEVMNEGSAVDTSHTTSSATFDTADGQHMTILYDASGDNAVLNFRDQQFVLVRTEAASGAKYTTADGSLEFWEQQGEATVTFEGATYVGVLAEPKL